MVTVFEKEWKPSYPYVTNNFAQGLSRKTKIEGLDYKWVQTAPKRALNILAFDLDDDEAESTIKTKVYDDEILPEPSWMTFNPATGHAHVAYVLEASVGTSKGLNYANDVRTRLNALLGADEAYKAFTTRNPLQHPTLWMTDHLYTLKELDAFTKHSATKLQKVESDAINGRNDLLFESLRTYAYKAYRRLGFSSAMLMVELEEKALEFYYSEIEDHKGFPTLEVASIVRSVHKWVTKNHTPEAFAAIQRKRVAKRWEAGKQDREDRLELILMMKEMGFTWKEIGENLGCSPATARTAYNRRDR